LLRDGFSSGGPILFSGNSVTNCTSGMTASFVGGTAGTTIEANGNTITNARDGAISAHGSITPVLLKGAGNLMRHNGYGATSATHGGLITTGGATIDFGGGDSNGVAVIGAKSTGLNVFCDSADWDIANGGSSSSTSIGARTNCFDAPGPTTSGPNIKTNKAAVVGSGACRSLSCSFAEPSCN
jgi:hypothetical protein